MALIKMGRPSQDFADSITSAISPRDAPTRDCCGREPTKQMMGAFEQFNRGLYWEQHETLEGIWRAEVDTSIRNFYKGIIQVGVGFHHLTRRNYIGAMKVLGRGINYLKPYAPECHGVDVERLIQEASLIYLRVEKLGPERIGEVAEVELPKIHYREIGAQ